MATQQHPLIQVHVAALHVQHQTTSWQAAINGQLEQLHTKDGHMVILTGATQATGHTKLPQDESSLPLGALVLSVEDPSCCHALRMAGIKEPLLCVVPAEWSPKQFRKWLVLSTASLSARPLPVHLPLGGNSGYVDVVTMKVHTPDGGVLSVSETAYEISAELARAMLPQQLLEGGNFPLEVDKASGELSPAMITRLIREAAECGLFTPVTCAHAQSQLDSLLGIVTHYVPSLLDMRQCIDRGYFVEHGCALPQWRALRRAVNASVTGVDDDENDVHGVPTSPYRLDRFVRILDRRITSKITQKPTQLDLIDDDDGLQQQGGVLEAMFGEPTIDDTAAMQRFSFNLGNWKLHVHDMTPASITTCALKHSAQADGMVALFETSSSNGFAQEKLSKATEEMLRCTLWAAKDLKVPTVCALDIIDSKCNVDECWDLTETLSNIASEDAMRSSGTSITPVLLQFPLVKLRVFEGVVDVVDLRAYMVAGDENIADTDIPPQYKGIAQLLHDYLFDTVERVSKAAGTQDLKRMIREGTIRQELLPVICFYSNATAASKHLLMKAVVDYLPSPSDLEAVQALFENGDLQRATQICDIAR